MPALFICKFAEDPVKNYVYGNVFRRSRASNSEVNSSQIWPEIEHVRDFIPVLVICKFDEDPIKN